MINELELVRNFYFTTKTKEARYSFLLNPDIPFEDTAIFWISKDDKDAVLFANKNWIFGLESLRRIAKRITSRLKERKDLNPPKELLEEEKVFQSSVRIALKNYQILELSLEIPNKDDFVLKVFENFQGKLLPAIYNGKNYSKIIEEYTVDYVFTQNKQKNDMLIELRKIETIFGDRGYFLVFTPKNFHKIEPDPDLPENANFGVVFTLIQITNNGSPAILNEHFKKASLMFEEYMDRIKQKN
ncbi:MAG: hypothetical protein QW228_06995 [Candidatus Aenigmatarchaeota archaeon]